MRPAFRVVPSSSLDLGLGILQVEDDSALVGPAGEDLEDELEPMIHSNALRCTAFGEQAIHDYDDLLPADEGHLEATFSRSSLFLRIEMILFFIEAKVLRFYFRNCDSMSRRNIRHNQRSLFRSAFDVAIFCALIFLFSESCFSAKARADLVLETNKNQITIDAHRENVLVILERLGEQAGFTVKWYGLRESAPLFSGKKSGTIEDLLKWVLRSQNHLIVHDRDPSLGQNGDLRPIQIILLSPPQPELRQGRAVREGLSSETRDVAAPAVGTAADTTPSPDPRLWLATQSVPAEDAADRAAPMGRAIVSAAGARLSEAGQQMPDLVIDPRDADIRVTVDVGGEVLRASYVMAHTPAGLSLQQTSPGRWEPWDGRVDSLIDNGLVPSNGRLTFEIMEGDLSEEFFPLTFTVAYQTEEALKYGVFQAMPDQQIAP